MDELWLIEDDEDEQIGDPEAVLEIGIDEVGRGAIAGPLCVGAVVSRCPGELDSEDIRDSKRMTMRQRAKAFERIDELAEDWIVVGCEAWEIDRLSIGDCLFAMMREAVVHLLSRNKDVARVTVDGRDAIPGVEIPQNVVVGADDLVATVSAASIMAKVLRDRWMTRVSLENPGYGFENNMGYGTGKNRAGVIEHGPSPHHRMTFAPISEAPETVEVGEARWGDVVPRLDNPFVEGGERTPETHVVGSKDANSN